MTGVINLYKPKGITSSDAVVKVKKLLHTGAVGHMGTLDPQGEGILILGVGKATRIFDYYLSKDKTYEADFSFGSQTDTLDGEGELVFSGGRIPDREEIIGVLSRFVGEQSQLPPAYSAKKVGGRKAYDLARSGAEVELKPCIIHIYSLELLDFTLGVAKVRVQCSSGTYIRSLCRDVASALGTYATMTAIKRTKCGSFDVEHSVPLDKLTENDVIPVYDALSEIEKLVLPDECYKKLVNGVKIEFQREGKFLVFCKNEFFGIGEGKDGSLKISVYMREEA